MWQRGRNSAGTNANTNGKINESTWRTKLEKAALIVLGTMSGGVGWGVVFLAIYEPSGSVSIC